MKQHRRKFFSLLLFAMSWSMLPVNGSPIGENDAGRIICLRRSVREYDAGTFFILTALDEDEDMICEPLSGSRRQLKIPTGSCMVTGYFRNTPPYEILMDICKDYGENGTPRLALDPNAYRMRCRLLKVQGQQEMAVPLLELDLILLQYLQTFRARQKKFSELVREKTPDEDAINDLVKELSSRLEQRITEALAVVTRMLNRDEPMLAVALYLHIRNFCSGLHPDGRSGLYFRDRDCLDGLQQVVRDLFRRCENDVLTLLRRRYRSQAHVKEFTALFPKARGLWSESPPADFRQLVEYSRMFYRCRKEEKEYAPVADFEQWGNCRLTLLLGSGAGKESAYLEQEFQAVIRKYQQIFSKP